MASFASHHIEIFACMVLTALISGLALLAASALLPPAAMPQHDVAARVTAHSLQMTAGEPERGRRSWRSQLRSGTSAVAAAALLALPRGPAQAAELEATADGAATISRDAGYLKCGRRRRTEQPAFLGFARKRKGLDTPLDRSMLRSNELDLDALVSPKVLRRFTERDFIFSDSLTYKGELAEELAELDAVKEDKKGAALISTLTQTGGALGLVYASAKALTAIERYFKRQEQKEIQDEIELTGNYISVDAGDVETVFDPSTGKNLTISKAPRAKANITATELAAPTGTLAKVLGFLGLGGAPAADDDGFWSAPQPTFKGPKKGGDGSGSGASSGPEGADGGSDGGDAEGKDGLEDDSSAVDELGDLLGGDAPGKKK